MKEMIIASILLAVSAVLFFLSARSFMGKGFLFNNAYIYASKQEREKMNKKPYYRQSAIVFLLLGCSFTLYGLTILLHMDWLFYIVLAVVFSAVVYAIASSVAIERSKNRKKAKSN